MPADLKLAFDNARYGIEAAGSGGLRADNGANGFSVQFSGAETTIDAGNGAQATLTLAGYGWGSALRPAGRITGIETTGKRLKRHYGTALTEWFVNTPEGLEQGFVVAERAAAASGPLCIRLGASGGWSVRGAGDGVRLTKGLVTLNYAGLKAWDVRGAALASRLRADVSSIEIEVDDARAVYPLTVDPTFAQQVKLTASDVPNGVNFGYSVALSSDGNTALVGALGTYVEGGVYVFTRSGAGWTQQQKLTPSDGGIYDEFGISVALSSDGNTALLGANDKNTGAGAAYVFTRSGTSWGQQQELTASDPANYDSFGWSVALSSDGNTALMGAIGKNVSTGAAYVFTRSGTSWIQQQKLNASDAAPNDDFGYSVALSSDGSTALVGADQKNSNQGAAYVFARSGTGWTQQQELMASVAAKPDQFGSSVALSSDGNTALVGAYGKNSYTGAAYVYVRSGTSWTQQQEVTPSDAAARGYFGHSVALSSDGNTAFFRANGAAYLFTRSATSWNQQQELPVSAASAALSSDGNAALFGVPYTQNSQTGAAYVFTPVTGFNTGFALNSPSLRNDFGGFVGMKLTVGSSPTQVTALGRVCVTGNAQSHLVKFVDATTGSDVPSGSVSINMSGCTPGTFTYATLPNPISLSAGASYYLASQENAGGDLGMTPGRSAAPVWHPLATRPICTTQTGTCLAERTPLTCCRISSIRYRRGLPPRRS